MSKFETIMVINPNLSEEEAKGVVTSITDLINNNGKALSVEEWGKKKLAYPIRKFNEGFYAFVEFASEPEFVDELERKYAITEEIIKHITVKKI